MENKADLVLPSSPADTLIHADVNGVNSMRPNDLPWPGVGGRWEDTLEDSAEMGARPRAGRVQELWWPVWLELRGRGQPRVWD